MTQNENIVLPGLRIRKLADHSGQERIVRFDPETGEKKLVNPHTEGDSHEPWPLLGVVIEGDTPARCRVSSSFVQRGVSEGWIELENSRPVHRPGGPPSNPWRITHTFIHADAMTVIGHDGDVRYRVVRQPDKYAVANYVDGSYGEATPVIEEGKKVTEKIYNAGDTDISWFYDLELES